ncbi:hypothetical protein WN944_020188 [Citrus x changshan-huyou]|uniref:Uncharacterized protein n=1 Tax=Citrus x changshan-huyou TaxID=2935761 RepID=A0AAP0LWP9_9ROSI
MLKRKKGAIVNIGSGAALGITSGPPLYSVYPAAKAVKPNVDPALGLEPNMPMDYWPIGSRCLCVEYKKSGIDVLCQICDAHPKGFLNAGYILCGNQDGINQDTFIFCPVNDSYLRAAIRWIGYEPLRTPYRPHSLLWCFMYLLPDSLINARLMQLFLRIRKKRQLKDARKKE